MFTSLFRSELTSQGGSQPDSAGAESPACSPEDLQQAYIWSINSALEGDGLTLADELADSYREESRALRQASRARKAA